MKNSSWKHPFPTFLDKLFDGNKDGKSDIIESAFRDAHIEEMKKTSENQNTRPKSNLVIPNNSTKKTVYNETETTKEKNYVNTPSAGIQLMFILIAVVVLVGGFIMALSTEGTMFIKAIILFGAVAIAIGLLKFVGLYK